MKTLWKTIAGLALVLASFTMIACHDDESLEGPSVEPTEEPSGESSDDSADENSEDSEAVQLSKGSDERPDWETPSALYTSYEQTMSVQVTLPKILLQYAGDDDLMCATIANDIRAVTPLERTGGQVYFPLVIAGNSGDGSVSLHYYCSSLQRLFHATDWKPFTPGISPTENGALYVPPFNVPE